MPEFENAPPSRGQYTRTACSGLRTQTKRERCLFSTALLTRLVATSFRPIDSPVRAGVYPAGAGTASILRIMLANSRRVSPLSASSSQ